MENETQDRWLVSALYGSNEYDVLASFSEEWALEEQKRVLSPSNPNLSGVNVRGLHDRKKMLLFIAPEMSLPRWKDMCQTVEKAQAKFLYDSRYLFPLDCVQGDTMKGLVVQDPDLSEYDSIDVHFVKPKSPRWEISLSLLQAVKTLHEHSVAMNGFERAQVLFNKRTGAIMLYPGEYVTGCDAMRWDVEREGYFLIPRKIRTEKNPNALTAEQQDIFSAAAMSFYLLFYTHPFIGGRFWEYSTTDYYQQYSLHPEFIFDPEGGNMPKNLEFDEIIKDQWERTVPKLKWLYEQLFATICGKAHVESDEIWNLNEWEHAFEEDAAKNDNETSRPSFPFQTVINYRV